MKRYVKGSLTSGLVGIWWIYNDQIIADMKTLDDGFDDGNYISYDKEKNHLSEWRRLVKEQVSDNSDEVIAYGYKGLERGRVIYNLRTMAYEVTCSDAVYHDLEARKLIIDAFELNNCRRDFVILQHYHIAKLTGNPALDSLEYE